MRSVAVRIDFGPCRDLALRAFELIAQFNPHCASDLCITPGATAINSRREAVDSPKSTNQCFALLCGSSAYARESADLGFALWIPAEKRRSWLREERAPQFLPIAVVYFRCEKLPSQILHLDMAISICVKTVKLTTKI